MPFYTDAYLDDFHHLSTAAHGAHLLILLHMWRLGGNPLPDDDKLMLRINVKLPSGKQWRKIKAELTPTLHRTQGGPVAMRKKLERTWNDVMKKIEQNRRHASLGRTQLKRNNRFEKSRPTHSE